ncbi:MAG: TonB-dependent receptor [Bryobacteraceae bacterium]
MKLRISIFVVLALFLAAALFGQEYRGAITGRALDPSGAAVPGAHVTVTNIETNVHITSDSNADGLYTMPYLQPGMYTLRAEHAGFKVFERTPIEIRINATVQVDAQLQLGNATETVNVQAATPLLDMASASQGESVDAKRVEELPIQQGVPYHLIALTPGVARTGTNMLDENPYDGTIIQYSVGGASASANVIIIDGAVTGQVSGGGNGPTFSPPQESVGEFRMMTQSYDSQQGWGQGASVSVSIKSGTNTIHGAIDDYGGGNGSFVANNALSVLHGLPHVLTGPYYRRELGVGGPVYIPKVYDGRNKTFWFVGYTGLLHDQVKTQNFTVPTVPEQSGDFSALLAVGSNYQIYDPNSRTPGANGRVNSAPLPGNIIPASIFNKTADSKIGVGLLQYWPQPNAGPSLGETADGTNNYYSPTRGQINWYTGLDLRFDHNFSDRNRWYGSMHRFDRHNHDYDIFNNDVSGDNWDTHPRGGEMDDVYVISPSFVVDARMSIDINNRLVTSVGSKVLNWRYTANGFPAYMDALIDPAIERMPSFSPGGDTGIPPGANLQYYVGLTYEPSLHFTKTHGTHTMNFGWDMLVRKDDTYTPGLGATGSYSFSGTYMVGPLDNSSSAPSSMGQGLAQMEYGLPNSSSITRTPSSASQSISHALYFQEDWRVSRRLTVNLGLRYEWWGPDSERFDRSTEGWNPFATHTWAPAVEANYLLHPTPEVSTLPLLGGLLFAGAANGGSHELYNSSPHDFMPRIGFSYGLTPKTVLHGGYGIFFGAMGDLFAGPSQAGYSVTTTTNASVNTGLTYANPLSNPFPTGVVAPLGAAWGVEANVGSSISVLKQNPADLYVQRWSLGIQRELPERVVVSISYNGSRGVHLSTSKALDALPNKYLSTLPTRDQTNYNYLTAAITNPFAGLVPAGTSLYSGTTVQRTQLLIPYPEFTGVSYNTQQGYNMYNSLQVNAERRFANGFTGTLAFTWQNDMSATGFLNSADPMPYKVPDGTDFPVSFDASGLYNLPIGHGHLLLGNSSKLVDSLLGGWQIQGVVRYQTGPPLGFGNSLLNGTCPTWASIALPKDQRNFYHEFNTSCFNTVSNQQLVDNLRTLPTTFSYIRGPNWINVDLSGIKRFKLGERVAAEMRWEFLNAFNNVWWGSIDTGPTSSTFGQATYENSAPRRVYWSGRITF